MDKAVTEATPLLSIPYWKSLFTSKLTTASEDDAPFAAPTGVVAPFAAFVIFFACSPVIGTPDIPDFAIYISWDKSTVDAVEDDVNNPFIAKIAFFALAGPNVTESLKVVQFTVDVELFDTSNNGVSKITILPST